MSDLFDGISDWLMTRALTDHDISDTVGQLAERLLDGGIPITRIMLGRAMLHPLIGLTDLKWDIETRSVVVVNHLRDRIQETIRDGAMANTPFGYMINNRIDHYYADLCDPAEAARFETFQQLADGGVTGWAAFARSFGRKHAMVDGFRNDADGGVISFSTRRFSGFSPADLDNLNRLIVPLFACVRVATDRLLTTELLETYLGRISGERVLTGQSERGDGEVIECVLLMSDLRNSVATSQTQSTSDYMSTLNTYFDCTAKAVLDHGGEVLKFIGDGILAIFPVDEAKRPREAMCTAALSAAREAFARADRVNSGRKGHDLPPIDFGVALHVGEVIYGNVGIAKRLDFTATGPAVGLAARVEGMTRTLNAPILATDTFAAHCAEQGTPMPAQEMRGFAKPVGLIRFDIAP